MILRKIYSVKIQTADIGFDENSEKLKVKGFFSSTMFQNFFVFTMPIACVSKSV